MMTTTTRRRTTAGESTSDPYQVGRWCFANDEECPYAKDDEVAEWYRGWLEMSSLAIEAAT